MKVISVHGVPRSGTSWLGQIFNSHPEVAYRFQPLFSYRFKDHISLQSTAADIRAFLDDLACATDDDFIMRGLAPDELHFQKWANPTHLVMKMVRYHHLIENLLDAVDELKVIGIVRNPCAVINSWLQAPREFDSGWDPLEEWRYAVRKNANRPEEYNGYEKWKEVALEFLDFQERYSRRFYLIQYETLVENPVMEVRTLLDFAGLSSHRQVSDFLAFSRSRSNPHPYSVTKAPSVRDRWRTELDKQISHAIEDDLAGTVLERFLL